MSRPVEGGGAGGAGAWFIQSAGQVWGPYPEARMSSFVEEGRVAADTLVGSRPDGPFAPAAHQPRLRVLFGEAEPELRPSAQAPPAPRPSEPIQPEAGGRPAPAAAAGVEQPLLIWTTLTGARADRFETLLGAYGPFARVHSGLWLVRARMGPAALRNALTRRIEAADTLMVIAAEAGQAAWFNLDGETDRTLRQLWAG